MKLKKLFGGLFLSFALIAGVGAGLLVKENRENAPVEKAEAADKPDAVYLKGDFNGWAGTDDTKMYFYGQSGSNYVYYYNFTSTQSWQGFKVDDQKHGKWCSTLGANATNLQVSGYTGNVELKDGAYGSYVLTYYYKSSTEFWMERCVSSTNWLTLTKKYSINGSDGGSAGSNQQLNFGASLSGITNPTAKTGYTFKGWYWDVSCSSAVSSSGVADGWSSPTGQTSTIYAKMEANDMTITKYAVVDGVKQASSIGSDTVKYNNTYAVPKGIYRANCAFGGWYTNEACTISYTARAITSNTPLYAKYTTHGAWAGTVHVDFRDSGWASAAANYAVCLMNKNVYTADQTAWSTYVMGTASGEHYISLSYSVPFEPNMMLVVRYDSTYSQASWNSQKWPTGGQVWGQTEDVTYSEMIRIGAETAQYSKKYNSYAGYPKIMGYSTGSWAQRALMDNVKSNDSHNAEYFATVTLAVNNEFKVLFAPYDSSYDYYSDYTTHSSLTSAFGVGSDNNIKCKTAGSYSIYFDSITNKIYITTQAISESDEWAHYFMDNVGCDATGTNVPTGWSLVAEAYSPLCDGAKNIIYNANPNPLTTAPIVEQAVARYDAAIRSHPGLTHFITNAAKTATRSVPVANPLIMISSETNNGILIAIIIGILSASAVGGYFFLRKKREEK